MNATKKAQPATWDREAIITLIRDRSGNLTAVARQLNCSRTTLYRYVTQHPTVEAALAEARETMLDNAESMLYKKVLDGDVTSLIFFLKTQGKSRGYVERVEQTGKDGTAIRFTILPNPGEEPD